MPKTIISCEYSSEWKSEEKPYYPVNDKKSIMYAAYKKLAGGEEIIFGGQLKTYNYYGLNAVIASTLKLCERGL